MSKLVDEKDSPITQEFPEAMTQDMVNEVADALTDEANAFYSGGGVHRDGNLPLDVQLPGSLEYLPGYLDFCKLYRIKCEVSCIACNYYDRCF
jgi:hypothetical protein